MSHPRSWLVAAIVVGAISTALAQSVELPAPQPRGVADPIHDLRSDDVDVRRRAAYALFSVHTHSEAVVPALALAMLDDDAYVRTTAARGLENHAGRLEPSFASLADVLTDGEADVRLDAVRALWRAGPVQGKPVAALVGVLGDDNPEVRANAAAALEWTGEPGRLAVPALRDRLSDEDASVRTWAARALGSIDGEALVGELVPRLASDDPDVRAESAGMLGYGARAAVEAVPALEAALSDKDPRVRESAARALAGIDPRPAVEALVRALEDPDPGVRSAALASLNYPGEEMRAAIPALRERLGAADVGTRYAAAVALASIDADAAAEQLFQLLIDDPEPLGRQGAAYGCVVLSRWMTDAQVATLVRAASDENPMVRNVVLPRLTLLGRRAVGADEPLLRAAAVTTDPFGSQFTLDALHALGVPWEAARPIVAGHLASDAPFVRAAALRAVQSYGGRADGLLPRVGEIAARDPDPNTRIAALSVLAARGDAARGVVVKLPPTAPGTGYLERCHTANAVASAVAERSANAVEQLVALIDADEIFGAVPVSLIGQLGARGRTAEQALVERLPREEGSRRAATAAALVNLRGASAGAALRDLTDAARDRQDDDAVRRLRLGAIHALGGVDGDDAGRVLLELLGDPDARVRQRAAGGLAQQRMRAALPALRARLGDSDRGVRLAAIRAIEAIEYSR